MKILINKYEIKFVRRFKTLLLLIPIFSFTSMLHAQQFEQGSGIGGCQAGSGVCNGWQWQGQQQGEQQQPSAPPAKWVDRWGAVAIGGDAGHPAIIGLSENMASRGSAESTALTKCKSQRGGETCSIKQSYANQCVALAWGNTGGGGVAVGRNTNEAQKKSLVLCSKNAPDCEVLYTDCSMPVRIQ